MFIVILALGTTDLLFALDSIPAIFGLTQEPYLVLMANVFALMGLRQLYFLLGDLLKRLVYLGLGLAVLLAFIGVKLILHALHENELPFINGGEHVPVWDIPIWFSLGAIVVILGVTAAASLAKTRGRARVPSSVGGREDHLHLDDVSLFGETQHRHEDRPRRSGPDSSGPGSPPAAGGEGDDRPGDTR